MGAITAVREGFRIAGRHKRLALVLWLAPLVPALVLAAIAAANLAPTLSRSLFADYALEGGWFVVLMEFRSSRADALGTILRPGVLVLAFFSILVQVALSAGVVETLLERRARHPFVMGIRRNSFRFLRTTGLMTLLTIGAAVGARLLTKGFSNLAVAQADGRYDILGFVVAGLFFLAIWAPLDLAADLSRISAATHDHRSMVRGFFRAWWTVVRRPGLLVTMYLIFLLATTALHGIYTALRSPWTPSTAAAILALLVVQQSVMIIRAFLKLGLWGAEISAFRMLDEPPWCRKRSKVEQPVREHAEDSEGRVSGFGAPANP
jgi:hypothetical protein